MLKNVLLLLLVIVAALNIYWNGNTSKEWGESLLIVLFGAAIRSADFVVIQKKFKP